MCYRNYSSHVALVSKVVSCGNYPAQVLKIFVLPGEQIYDAFVDFLRPITHTFVSYRLLVNVQGLLVKNCVDVFST